MLQFRGDFVVQVVQLEFLLLLLLLLDLGRLFLDDVLVLKLLHQVFDLQPLLLKAVFYVDEVVLGLVQLRQDAAEVGYLAPLSAALRSPICGAGLLAILCTFTTRKCLERGDLVSEPLLNGVEVLNVFHFVVINPELFTYRGSQ